VPGESDSLITRRPAKVVVLSKQDVETPLPSHLTQSGSDEGDVWVYRAWF
jgi:hypothetical protein